MDLVDRKALSLVLIITDLALAGLARRIRAQNLHRALETTDRTGAAIGILVGLSRYTEDDARQAMAAARQAHNRRLNDIASEVVLTGVIPTLVIAVAVAANSARR